MGTLSIGVRIYNLLKRCNSVLESIHPIEGLGVDENISYDEVPIEIFDRQLKNVRNKEVTCVKVL